MLGSGWDARVARWRVHVDGNNNTRWQLRQNIVLHVAAPAAVRVPAALHPPVARKVTGMAVVAAAAIASRPAGRAAHDRLNTLLVPNVRAWSVAFQTCCLVG